MLSRISTATAKAFAIVALTIGLGGAASAATFTFDGSSDIDLTYDGGGCAFLPCNLNAEYTSGFTMGGPATQVIDNFITWTITGSKWGIGIGGKEYDVVAHLNFTTPNGGGSGSTEGDTKFKTVFGLLSGGKLIWDNGGVGEVDFGNNVKISWVLDDEFVVGLGYTAYSGATFTTTVPVPAAGFLLVGALGGLAALRRRRKAA